MKDIFLGMLDLWPGLAFAILLGAGAGIYPRLRRNNLARGTRQADKRLAAVANANGREVPECQSSSV
jgi:hypothetical protein